MSSSTQSLTRRLALALALIVVLAVAVVAAGSSSHPKAYCFDAAYWGPASDDVRPCVEVTRVFEDGSFSYRVSDADGVTRYTAGIGALDR